MKTFSVLLAFILVALGFESRAAAPTPTNTLITTNIPITTNVTGGYFLVHVPVSGSNLGLRQASSSVVSAAIGSSGASLASITNIVIGITQPQSNSLRTLTLQVGLANTNYTTAVSNSLYSLAYALAASGSNNVTSLSNAIIAYVNANSSITNAVGGAGQYQLLLGNKLRRLEFTGDATVTTNGDLISVDVTAGSGASNSINGAQATNIFVGLATASNWATVTYAQSLTNHTATTGFVNSAVAAYTPLTLATNLRTLVVLTASGATSIATNSGQITLTINTNVSGGGGISGSDATNIFTGLAISSNWLAASTFNTSTSAIVGLIDSRSSALSNYTASVALTNANGVQQRLITNQSVKTFSAGSNMTITDQGTNLVLAASLAGGAASLQDVTNIVESLSVLSNSGTGTSNTFTSPALVSYPHVSTNTFVLSSILGRGDADLSQGSTDYGTIGDVGPQLQSILDKATNGPIHIVVDGGYPVGQTLIVHPFTHIELRLGGGLILRSNVNNSLLKNRSWGLNTTMDEGISITGFGTLNGGGWDGAGNPLQQHSSLSNNWTSIVSFHGVERPYFGQGVQLVNPRTFAVHLGRCNNGTFLSSIDVGPNAVVNQDGYHLNGPATNNTFADFTVRAFDDGVSIAANDGGTNCTTCVNGIGTLGYAGWDGGPIDGVRIHNITFDDSDFGVRFLSTATPLLNVDLDGLYGQTTAHAILLDRYSDAPGDINLPGFGAYGSIRIRNVQTKVLYRNYYLSTIYIDGHGDQISIGDAFNNYQEPVTFAPYIQFHTNNVWKQVSIHGLDLITTSNQSGLENTIVLGGSAGQLSITGNKFLRTNSFGLYPINMSMDVGQLILKDNQAYGYRQLVSAINPDFDNVITNSVVGGNLVYPGVYVDSFVTNLSDGVYRFAAGANVRTVETDSSNIGNDASVSFDFFLEGSVGTNSAVVAASRVQNGIPWFTDARRRNYSFALILSDQGNESMHFTVKNGDWADVVLRTSGGFAADLQPGWHRMEFDTTEGVNRSVDLAARVFRYSDSKWLQSNFVWSASKVDAFRANASGTNYWKPPVAATAMGYIGYFSTNATMIGSNFVVRPSVPSIDSVPNLIGPEINIGGGAAGTPAYVGTTEKMVVKSASGDRTAVQIVSPTNAVQVVAQAVEPASTLAASGYIGTTTDHPFSLISDEAIGLTVLQDGSAQAKTLRMVGPVNQLEFVDRSTNGVTNAVYTANGSLNFYTFPLNQIVGQFSTNGNFLSYSNIVAVNGRFIGNGGGITNLPFTTTVTNISSITPVYSNGVINVLIPQNLAALATNNAASLTNMHQTNLVTGLQSWLAIPASIPMQRGLTPNPIMVQTNGNATITSWVPVSGLPSNAYLAISNSSGGNITITTTGTGRFIGTATNSLVIGSGKLGFIYVESFAGASTNIMGTIVQQ